jgi:hypothetical protein
MPTSLEVHEEHHCPFCHGHKDPELIWHELAETYVCLGCRHEIDCGLDFDEQPTADNYNCYDTIERLLQRLGISYAELQQRYQRLDDAR